MFIYGTSGEKIQRSEPVFNCACPSCNSSNTMNTVVMSRYAHLWFIPLFPISKRVVISCSNCKSAYKPVGFAPDVEAGAQQLKQDTSFPVWYWSGLAIIAFIAAYIFFASR